MAFPITGAAALINCLVLLFFYFRLKKTPVKDNEFFYLFRRFIFCLGVFYLFFIPVLLVPDNAQLIGWEYLIGHAVVYIGLGYLAKTSFLIASPSSNRNYIFWIYIALGAALTALNIYYINTPTVVDGIVHWNQNPLVGILIVLFVISAFIPAAVLFIRESFMQPQQARRFAFIGIALLVISIAGPLHDIATIPSALITADMVRTLAYMLMFWGVISKTKAKVNRGK